MNKKSNTRNVTAKKKKGKATQPLIFNEKTLAAALRQHFEIKKFQCAPSTNDITKRKMEQLIGWIGDRELATICTTDIELLVVDLYQQGYKGNTINQYLDLLRQVYARAVNDSVISASPMDGIKKCKFETEEPDPFYQHEIQAFLGQKDLNLIDVALIQLGITTGMRISELMAVSAEAVNLDKKTLLIDLALVDGVYKVPKTKSSKRTIELSNQAVDALRILLSQTHCKAKSITVRLSDNRTVTTMTRTLLAYYSARKRIYRSVDEYREKFFRPFCKVAGVRYRGPSHFRHTYASQLLSAGISIEWIARQMGHTGTEMILRHYGRWLMEDAPDFRGKADTVFNTCIHGHKPKADLDVHFDENIDIDALLAKPQMMQKIMNILCQRVTGSQ